MDAFRPRSSMSSVLDAYPVRIMLGLMASLSLVLALVHLPLQKTVSRVGWSAQSSVDRIALSDVEPERSPENEPNSKKKAASEGNTPPPTDHRPPRSEQSTRSAAVDDPEPDPTQSDSGLTSEHEDVQSVAALGIEDRKPRVVGGVGSLYLHINYPEKARRKGIEGQLRLEFMIETDGTVSDIEVIDSLHPLCDSAAVKGLRSVKFVPAKHNGTPVPIRLELPIKFELTAVSRTLSQNGPNP